MSMQANNFEWFRSAMSESHQERARKIPSELGPTIEKAWHQVCSSTGLSVDSVVSQVADYLGFDVMHDVEIKPSVVNLIPESVAKKFCLIPIVDETDRLIIAVANPLDKEAIQQAGFISGRAIEVVVAAPAQIIPLIEEKYKESSELASVVQQASKKLDGKTILVRGRTISSFLTDTTPATEKLFLLILREAVNSRVSDIHIQPFVGGAAVRFRIDGVMKQIKSMPIAVMQKLIRHVKALADLDVTNSRTPQDGRLTLVVGEVQRDLRLSILPIDSGARLVIRVLAHDVQAPGTLNFQEEQAAMFTRSMRSTSGMILVTGPTGSGKTTTLYSMLGLLNHDATNIMSVEDPVEIRMRGVSQSSVHPEQGLTFPFVLRSMLRQDPDVILVGEIRDNETAELALRASLTGHLVLSTLHTIDAVTTIPRLVDLGLGSVLLADSLLCVINQRLARKLCEDCKVQVDVNSATDQESLYLELIKQKHVWRSTGCARCNHTGFKGRIPIAQVWNFTDDVRNHLRRGQSDYEELTEMAKKRGLVSLNEVGRTRIAEGLTSVDEIVRVLGTSFWSELGSENHSVLESIGKTDRVSMHEKILIVQADDELRSQIAAELESRDYIVTAVATMEEAVTEIESENPLDLLLLDLEKGQESVMRSFSDLRGALSWVGLSAILLLPERSETIETMLEIHGASDYLIKPASVSKISDRVEAVLKRRHL